NEQLRTLPSLSALYARCAPIRRPNRCSKPSQIKAFTTATLLVKRAPKLRPRFGVTKFATGCKSLARSIRRHFARLTCRRIQPHRVRSLLPLPSLSQPLPVLIIARGLDRFCRRVHLASRIGGLRRTGLSLVRRMNGLRLGQTRASSQKCSVSCGVADIYQG